MCKSEHAWDYEALQFWTCFDMKIMCFSYNLSFIRMKLLLIFFSHLWSNPYYDLVFGEMNSNLIILFSAQWPLLYCMYLWQPHYSWWAGAAICCYCYWFCMWMWQRDNGATTAERLMANASLIYQSHAPLGREGDTSCGSGAAPCPPLNVCHN